MILTMAWTDGQTGKELTARCCRSPLEQVILPVGMAWISSDLNISEQRKRWELSCQISQMLRYLSLKSHSIKRKGLGNGAGLCEMWSGCVNLGKAGRIPASQGKLSPLSDGAIKVPRLHNPTIRIPSRMLLAPTK